MSTSAEVVTYVKQPRGMAGMRVTYLHVFEEDDRVEEPATNLSVWVGVDRKKGRSRHHMPEITTMVTVMTTTHHHAGCCRQSEHKDIGKTWGSSRFQLA